MEIGVFLVGVLVVALLMLAVVSAGAGNRRSRRRGRGGRPQGKLPKVNVAERWATVEAISAGGAAGLKQAISEADKLFDHVMRQQGFPGETMADRLKVAQSRLSNRQSVWDAHKLRNALAHEVGFDLVPSQAREALRAFERGLHDLGAL